MELVDKFFIEEAYLARTVIFEGKELKVLFGHRGLPLKPEEIEHLQQILIDTAKLPEIKPAPQPPYIPEPKVATPLKGRPTFVYLMLNHRNGFWKIGHSKNPSIREKTLQSQEPEVEMKFVYPANQQAEEDLHAMFNKKRVRGEWFALTERDVLRCQKFLKKLV